MGELITEVDEVEVQVDKIKEPRTMVERHFDENKVAQLVESIKLLGLLHAITISADNVLIAGKHRLAAVKRLGRKTIKAKILPISGIMAELVSIDENFIHAGLTFLEESEHLSRREEILAELGQRATQSTGAKIRKGKHQAQSSAPDDENEPKIKTTKDLATEAGMSERSAQVRLQVTKCITKPVRNKLRNTDIANNASELLRLAKVTRPEDQNTVVDMVIKKECKTIKEAVSKLMHDEQKRKFSSLAADVKKLPDSIKLICKDFFDAEGDENFHKHNSIDVIITDPPYVDEWKENWAPFLGIAADVLKPGGFLICYVGHMRLPEFFEGLRETQIDDPGKVSKNNKLEFFWECSLDQSGSIKAVHARSVQCGHKPIQIAYKPPMKQPYQYFNDLIRGSGRSKKHHEWEQSVDELIPLIDAFTKPGDIVLDPFGGACTTAVACKKTARKCICYDLFEENIKIGIKRVTDLDDN
jgi:hypothetical protein